MANHRGVKLCKAKGQYPENRMANVQMSQTVFTDLYTQSRTLISILLGFLVDTHCRCCNSDFVQLGLSLWPRELDKPP